MDVDATKFPIDFDTLGKGSLIAAEVIEKYRQVRCPSSEFAFAALQFKELVKTRLAARGLHVVIVSDGSDLRILTDAEASTYCAEQTHTYIRRALRQHRDLLRVDVAQLTDDEKAAHERSVINNSKYVQALASAGSRYRLVAHQRATPGLPSAMKKEQSDVQADEV